MLRGCCPCFPFQNSQIFSATAAEAMCFCNRLIVCRPIDYPFLMAFLVMMHDTCHGVMVDIMRHRIMMYCLCLFYPVVITGCRDCVGVALATGTRICHHTCCSTRRCLCDGACIVMLMGGRCRCCGSSRGMFCSLCRQRSSCLRQSLRRRDYRCLLWIHNGNRLVHAFFRSCNRLFSCLFRECVNDFLFRHLWFRAFLLTLCIRFTTHIYALCQTFLIAKRFLSSSCLRRSVFDHNGLFFRQDRYAFVHGPGRCHFRRGRTTPAA